MITTTKAALALALMTAAPAAQAATFTIGPIAASGVGVAGTAGNTILSYNLGANAHITNIAHALTLTTIDPSWLSEQTLRFGTSMSAQANFTPGFATPQAGTERYVGNTDLVALGLDFFLSLDGVLQLEFTDIYNGSGVASAFWSDVNLVVTYDAGAGTVPEPAAWALMMLGIGGVGGRLRYRRRATVAFAG